MRYLVRMDPSGGLNDRLLPSLRIVAKLVGVEVRNPKRTSYGALELDIFAPSGADFEMFLAAAEPLGTLEFASDLNVAPPHLSDVQLFQEARLYFNSERYWECHETLERAWRLMAGKEKLYVQGIILVCAAFVHHQKGEGEVALGVLDRAMKQLNLETRLFHGIDVNSLRRHVERIFSSGRFETFRI
jgi:uncharacterized protein